MDPDPPEVVGPRTRWTFTIRSMMAVVVTVAALLGYQHALHRSHRRAWRATTQLAELGQQLAQSDPTLRTTGANLGSGTLHWLGGDMKLWDELRTVAGREITVAVEVHMGILRDGPNRVTFESAGRSVTWPFEDLERGRKVDLRALFPEAFR
jgi:hypothetical protein